MFNKLCCITTSLQDDDCRLIGSVWGSRFLYFMKNFLIVMILSMLLWGCAIPRGAVTTDGSLPSPEMIRQDDKTGDQQGALSSASFQLTSKGAALLKQGNFDGAIRILEQAVSVNPSDGAGYYYLSEAWRRKENFRLAIQFNRLAMIYLRNSMTWSGRAEAQKQILMSEQRQKSKND